MITVFSISLLYLKLCLNMDRLIISLNCTSFHLSLIIVILGFKVICYSQDFWQKSPLMFMITAICYLRLTYKLTMLFDALEFWSANFCQFTAHETSHPTGFLWREVQNQAENGLRYFDRMVAPAVIYVMRSIINNLLD